MADESNAFGIARLVRWLALAVLIVFAVALYFRDGARVAPFGPASSADSASGR